MTGNPAPEERQVESIAEENKTSLTLLHRARSNDPMAWSKLFGRYHDAILSRCLGRWDLNRHDGENATQDVFSAICRKLNEFQRRRTGSFRKWIQVITDNKCRDFLRQTPLAPGVGGEDMHEAIENVPDPAAGTVQKEFNPSFVEEGSPSYLMHRAQKVLQEQKKPRDWQIFSAIAIENRNREEIAAELGITVNTVNLVFSRMRKALKEEFLRQINSEEGEKPDSVPPSPLQLENRSS